MIESKETLNPHHLLSVTLNIAPENTPLEKEKHLQTNDFWVPMCHVGLREGITIDLCSPYEQQNTSEYIVFKHWGVSC